MPGSRKVYQKEISKIIWPDITLGIKTVIVLAGVTLIFGFLIWWLNHNSSLQHIWETFPLDKKISFSFCENIGVNNPVRQPINTFSNIVYLVVSIIIFKTISKDRCKENSNNLFSRSTAYSILFGFILLYVFFASSFYHASLIPFARKLDYSAVFSFSLFPTTYFLHRRVLAKKIHLQASQKGRLTFMFFFAYVLSVFLLSFFIPRGKESLAALILIQIFFVLAFFAAIDKLNYHEKGYLIFSVASVLIALMWFEFDKYKFLCSPNSYFQTHSFWNLFIGLSAFYFFLYIRSQPDSGTLN